MNYIFYILFDSFFLFNNEVMLSLLDCNNWYLSTQSVLLSQLLKIAHHESAKEEHFYDQLSMNVQFEGPKGD